MKKNKKFKKIFKKIKSSKKIFPLQFLFRITQKDGVLRYASDNEVREWCESASTLSEFQSNGS